MTAPSPVVHVVDDDESLRTALMRLLKAAGYAVRGDPSAGEYLLAKPETGPGCVLLDVRMRPARAVSICKPRTASRRTPCPSSSSRGTAISR